MRHLIAIIVAIAFAMWFIFLPREPEELSEPESTSSLDSSAESVRLADIQQSQEAARRLEHAIQSGDTSSHDRIALERVHLEVR